MADPFPEELGGILLTGGTSRRMGRDKARLLLDGVTLAERTAQLLREVVNHAIEVGGKASTLPAVREDPPGSGPLGAIVAGHHALLDAGLTSGASCLVLACDLPLLTGTVLATIAHWPGDKSVIPVIGGMTQPLCARWSAQDLAAAWAAFRSGERSLRSSPNRTTAVLLEEELWGDQRAALMDVDAPGDLRRLGLDGRLS